ncbi:serine/threonine protein kinase [Blastococcus sp. SYSU D00922]
MEPHSRLLGDRYELLVPLASGGMGRVWRGRDTLLERPVAIKVLRSEFSADRTFRARFRAEAQHTAALHHPGIASVFDYGEAVLDGEALAYLVMELVEGETLSDLLEREGRLDAARTLDLLRQASSALAAAHAAGVVHRDVKPGNILVRPDGVAKITDFGIAWSASSVPLTRTGQVIGTAHYLSPEQAAGGQASPASDVYALGAVAYECLAGRRAFDGENSVQVALKQIREEPAPLPADVPAGVRSLVEKAMAKDPASRYPDGAALRAAVDAAADPSATAPIGAVGRTGTAVLRVPAAATPPAAVRRRRLPLPLLAGAGAAVVAILLAVLLLNGLGGTSGETPAQDATTSAPQTPRTVAVAAADLVGRPVDDVQAELVAAGLQVDVVPVESTAVAAGLVTAASPEGDLAPDALVTLSYAVAPVPQPEPRPGPGNGPGGEEDGPGGGKEDEPDGDGDGGPGRGKGRDD